MKAKIIIVSVITLVLVGVTFKLKSNKRAVEENVYRPDAEKKVLVHALKAEWKKMDQSFAYTGTFAPFREVMLIPQVQGQVKSISFAEGDFVREGKTLVQIDDDLLQAQHISAEANYLNAKRNLERYENASAGGGVSKLQLDNLKLALTSAESTLKQLRKQIELSRITAPFSGTMTLRSTEPGAVVGGSPVGRITDLSQLKLEISVPEKEAVFFKEGETTKITTDVYPGNIFVGIIDYVSDRGDQAHNYTVRILVRNSTATFLKAGMYGTAVLKRSQEKHVLTIPRSALLGSAKNPQVFVVHDGIALFRNIETGVTNSELVEVISGLDAGEMVVTTGHINLSHGSKVDIAK
jgi:RND family efflux transporter MFP subunit